MTYYPNGGTNAPAAQTKKATEALTLTTGKPAKFFKLTFNANGGSVSSTSKTVDCAFRCWNTDVNGYGADYASGATYSVNDNIALYAQWKNPAAGTLPTPVRSGYTFLGWFTAATGGAKVTSATLIDKNMTLYAHWQAE